MVAGLLLLGGLGGHPGGCLDRQDGACSVSDGYEFTMRADAARNACSMQKQKERRGALALYATAPMALATHAVEPTPCRKQDRVWAHDFEFLKRQVGHTT
jgi:hypothetical protein